MGLTLGHIYQSIVLDPLLRGIGTAIYTASTEVPDPFGLQVNDLMILFIGPGGDDPVGTGWVDISITGGLFIWWRRVTLDVNDEYETGSNYFAGFSQKIAFKVQVSPWNLTGFGTAQNFAIDAFEVSGIGGSGGGSRSVVIAAGRRVVDYLQPVDTLDPHDSGLFSDATLAVTSFQFGNPHHYYDAFSYIEQDIPTTVPFGQWDGANDGFTASVQSRMWRWDFN